MKIEKIKDILSKMGLFNIFRVLFNPIFSKIRSLKFNRNNLKALKKIVFILKKEKIKYWLECGTLLGIIREKRLLKYDLDIDIGIYYRSEKEIELIKELLIKNEYSLKFEIILDNKKTLHQCYIDLKNKVQVDLDFYIKEGNDLYLYEFTRGENISYGETIKKYGGLLVSRYKFNYFTTKSIKFMDYEIDIPQTYKKVLEGLYGKNWIYPDKKWNVKDSEKLREKQKNSFGVMKIYEI